MYNRWVQHLLDFRSLTEKKRKLLHILVLSVDKLVSQNFTKNGLKRCLVNGPMKRDVIYPYLYCDRIPLYEKACQHSPFEPKNVELTYVRRRCTDDHQLLTLVAVGGFLAKGGKLIWTFPATHRHLQSFPAILDHSRIFLIIPSHSNGSKWARTLILTQ
jgi:hypothetical protein